MHVQLGDIVVHMYIRMIVSHVIISHVIISHVIISHVIISNVIISHVIISHVIISHVNTWPFYVMYYCMSLHQDPAHTSVCMYVAPISLNVYVCVHIYTCTYT